MESAEAAVVDNVVRHPPVPDGTRITLATMPDDFHHHFRDGAATADVLRHASLRFGRAIAMPNLKVSESLSLILSKDSSASQLDTSRLALRLVRSLPTTSRDVHPRETSLRSPPPRRRWPTGITSCHPSPRISPTVTVDPPSSR
jgi:hypothetical protein